jgi:DNA-binding LytR/AlgR family response regulator
MSTQEQTITCVIAEDEELFINALQELLLRTWPQISVVALARDGLTALEAITQHQPAIAFLDIRMPEMTGLQIASSLVDASPETNVVFVTAYDNYALSAFETGAIDYLLKPIDETRFATTIERLKKRLTAEAPEPVLLAALSRKLNHVLRKELEEPDLHWITASVGKDTRLIAVEDVLYFRADSGYTVVMTADFEALLRTPIREIVSRLNPTIFKQIHRSTIVNMRAVSRVSRDESGRGTLWLKGRDESLPVSLSFMPLFRSM